MLNEAKIREVSTAIMMVINLGLDFDLTAFDKIELESFIKKAYKNREEFSRRK